MLEAGVSKCPEIPNIYLVLLLPLLLNVETTERMPVAVLVVTCMVRQTAAMKATVKGKQSSQHSPQSQ